MTAHSASLQWINPSSNGSFGLPELTEFAGQRYTTRVAESWSQRILTEVIGQTDAMQPTSTAGQPVRYNHDDLVTYFDHVEQTASREFVHSRHSPGMVIMEMLADALPAPVAA